MIPISKPIQRRKPFRPKRRKPKKYVVGGLIIYPDGREVCRENQEGRRIYKQRTMAMRERQGELCCLCGLWMHPDDTTFEHERSRGMGGAFRDDRSEVDGVRVNGAAHELCNGQKGSRRVEYVVQ